MHLVILLYRAAWICYCIVLLWFAGVIWWCQFCYSFSSLFSFYSFFVNKHLIFHVWLSLQQKKRERERAIESSSLAYFYKTFSGNLMMYPLWIALQRKNCIQEKVIAKIFNLFATTLREMGHWTTPTCFVILSTSIFFFFSLDSSVSISICLFLSILNRERTRKWSARKRVHHLFWFHYCFSF